MEITRQAATDLIINYCIDEPKDEQAAIEAIMSIPASDLTEINGTSWIEVAGGMGMHQDKIDAVIYNA